MCHKFLSQWQNVLYFPPPLFIAVIIETNIESCDQLGSDYYLNLNRDIYFLLLPSDCCKSGEKPDSQTKQLSSRH